ncbi:ADP-ribosylation factor-like protein 9 [Chanos chanos]|uniref:ADP-ribosylation factor-like protein 9 n=1 Tax=Chanos chanos TaxID=29144 RepID=A0A6J2USY0_CHACN|nr:ADP-ribosylation factor-like protein 9 [Chanos chanos]
MPGLREAGLVGAAVVTGGVAYLAWSFVFATKNNEPKKVVQDTNKEKKDANKDKQEEPIEEEIRTETAQKVSTVSESKPAANQILVLGLDGAGKTSLLHCFATGSVEQDVTPTQGFNAVSINKEDLQIEFLEIGGTENLREYWQKYLCKALMLVFVVDSSDAEKFPLAKAHLHQLLSGDPHLPLVVLANKQDLPGACGITDIHEALSLASVGEERKLFLISTHVKKGDTKLSSGVEDARDLILQMVSDSR